MHKQLAHYINTMRVFFIIMIGTWSEWSSFSACSRTCNGGTQVRTRTCQNGDACEGQNSQERSCNTEDCVVGKYITILVITPSVYSVYYIEPTWGQWSSWSACSDSCGTGTRMRSRQCLNGNTCDTKQGSGTNMDIENCNTQECPIRMLIVDYIDVRIPVESNKTNC